MRLSDIIRFRRDLLFQGAVQVGWLESDRELARKAAEHFVFHGPEYHGLSQSDFGDGGAYRLIDTATFTQNLLNHLVGKGRKENPITLAVAGYGTGKSHLALTLAKMLSEPRGEAAEKIMANLSTADRRIGGHVEALLRDVRQPYLVIAINGMLDFDLSVEIVRQVFARLGERGIDTTPLEELRPRFASAQTFTINSFQAFRNEFAREFGPDCSKEEIILRLKQQDEEAFVAVNNIFRRKTGQSLRAVAHESLQGFLTVVNQRYCGVGKPFAGVVIFFDEFGRYLEFAAKRPHIAGAGGLQQLFEAVQANSDAILLLCFIQYELKAYASRIAPEARESLERYISRYDMAQKARLSTNLETIIANLIEKKDPRRIKFHIDHIVSSQQPAALMLKLKRWFPEIRNHALWNNPERFHQVIQKGCWPMHPASTWLLYRLSSVGKSLQQRSAMSFLDDVCERHEDEEIELRGWTIPPVALCTQEMIDEFLGSEQPGQQGSTARAYESVLARYDQELSPAERKQLKSVLLAAKVGLKTRTQAECLEALAMLSGLLVDVATPIIDKLRRHGEITWISADCSRQFELKRVKEAGRPYRGGDPADERARVERRS